MPAQPLNGKRMQRVRRRAVTIRAALERLGGEATARQIAQETGLMAREVAAVLSHMQIDGVVTGEGNYTKTWRLAKGVVR